MLTYMAFEDISNRYENLHNCKEKARLVVSEESTYMMINWSNFGTGIDQSSMKMRWISDNDDDSAQFDYKV